MSREIGGKTMLVELRNSKPLSHPALALCTFALSALPLPALADDGSGDPIERLGEVTVTASKRETNLMETPLAVSAITQDYLDREGLTSARDLSGTVPNLQLATGPDSGTATTIRGVTSTDFTEVGEGAVAIHLDGFYSPRPQGALALLYDLERIEVLRGPQGTLFGMNSPGGAINIIPAKPEFGQSFAKLEGAFGNYDEIQARGMFNWGVDEKFALRAAVLVDRHDGMLEQGKDLTDLESPQNGIPLDGIPDVDQRRNHDVDEADWYNNKDEWAARVIGRWQANDWLEVTGLVSRFSDQGAGDIDYVDCEQAAGTVNACDHQLRFVNINVPGRKDMTIDDYQLKFVADVGERLAIEYRASYQDQKRSQLADIDGGSHPAAEWSSIGEPLTAEAAETFYYPIWDESWETKHSTYETTTHELQFKSAGDSKLQYVTGLYYLHEKKQIRYDMEMLNVKTWYEDPSLPLGYNPDGLPDSWVFDQAKRTTTSKAAFAQLDYRILEKVNLTAGYRYTDDEKTDENGMTYAFWWGDEAWYNGEHTVTGVRAHQSNDLTTNMGSWAPLGTVMPGGNPNNVKQSWSQGTYRLGAQYFAADQQMLFASVATGYKMGGMYEMFDTCNNGCLALLSYDPENVTTYELGYKATLLDGRLRLSTTAFFSDYTDMQNTGEKVVGVDENPNSPNFGEPVLAWSTDNLTSSEIKGLEVEFDLIPWSHGRLFGYLAWLDTKIVDGGSYQDGYACAERVIYGQPPCGSPETADIRGNHLPFAPEYSLTFNYEHSIGFSSGYSFSPLVTVYWQSEMWLDILNYDGAHLSQAQDAYTKLNMSLRLYGPNDRFYFEAFGENLTDEDTKNFFGFNRGMVKGSYDPPRTYGLRAGFSF
jgi:iron complex outermembrane receptor protein